MVYSLSKQRHTLRSDVIVSVDVAQRDPTLVQVDPFASVIGASHTRLLRSE